MNSKERGISPAKGKMADRLPMWYGADKQTTKQLVEFLNAGSEEQAVYDILNMDYKTFRPRYIGPELNCYDNGTWDTIWGIRRGGYYGGHAVNAPLSEAESLNDVMSYRWPDVLEWDYKIPQDELYKARDYCIMGGSWSQFFHDASELLGLEKFLVDMYFNETVVEAVLEKCFDFYFEQTVRMFEENPGIIDIWFCGNDFGTQKGLLFSPEMWRKFFKAKFKKMSQFAHKNGALMAVHSCGSITEIIPDLIDVGVDILNPIQISAEGMDPTFLKREFGKDIVFFGGIDTNIMISGTQEQVRQETRRIIDILGSDGKYIVAPSHDYLLPEVPAGNIAALYNEAKAYSTV
jgi:uroporphyrinogen decarboxylase